jgi:hypothetical protein
MAVQPALNRQRSPRGTFSSLSRSPNPPSTAVTVPRSASTSSLQSSESSSQSPPTPPILATTLPPQSPDTAAVAANANDSQGTRPSPRKATSLYTDLTTQTQSADAKQDKNPFRFTQAPKQAKVRTLRQGDSQGDIHS